MGYLTETDIQNFRQIIGEVIKEAKQPPEGWESCFNGIKRRLDDGDEFVLLTYSSIIVSRSRIINGRSRKSRIIFGLDGQRHDNGDTYASPSARKEFEDVLNEQQAADVLKDLARSRD